MKKTNRKKNNRRKTNRKKTDRKKTNRKITNKKKTDLKKTKIKKTKKDQLYLNADPNYIYMYLVSFWDWDTLPVLNVASWSRYSIVIWHLIPKGNWKHCFKSGVKKETACRENNQICFDVCNYILMGKSHVFAFISRHSLLQTSGFVTHLDES